MKLEDIQRRVPLWHQSIPFIALWSEKSNCTALAKWFFFQIGLLDDALRFSSWIHDYEIQVFKTDEYMVRCFEAINSGIPCIKFVRNPYDRAFSGYLELCKFRPDEPEHWSIPIRRQVIGHYIGTDTELEYAFSFHQYLKWLRLQQPSQLDLHLAPQHVEYESEIDVEVFKVEDGRVGFGRLESRFGLQSTRDVDTIFESSHYHDRVNASNILPDGFCDLAIPLHRSENFQLFKVPAEHIASTSAGALVREIFAKDFSNYRY